MYRLGSKYETQKSHFIQGDNVDEKIGDGSSEKRESINRQRLIAARRKQSARRLSPFIFAFSIVIVAVLLYFGAVKDVFIYEDGELLYELKTTSRTVDELFAEIDMELHPADSVTFTGGDYLYAETVIDIERAFPVFITADQEVREVWTTGINIADLLLKEQYELGIFDEVYPKGEELASPYEEIKIVRIEKNYTALKITIPYESVTRDNPALARGTTRVVTAGSEGIRKETVEIVYADGQEVSREVVEEEIIEEPQDEIVEKGTKVVAAVATVSHSAISAGNIEFGNALNVNSTAYCTCSRCTGSGNGITATGAPAIAGNGTLANPHVIAVDPNVIPLRSTVYIEGYGYARALDTGGAIKGNKIDLLFSTHQEALRFGRRTLKVYLVQ